MNRTIQDSFLRLAFHIPTEQFESCSPAFVADNSGTGVAAVDVNHGRRAGTGGLGLNGSNPTLRACLYSYHPVITYADSDAGPGWSQQPNVCAKAWAIHAGRHSPESHSRPCDPGVACAQSFTETPPGGMRETPSRRPVAYAVLLAALGRSSPAGCGKGVVGNVASRSDPVTPPCGAVIRCTPPICLSYVKQPVPLAADVTWRLYSPGTPRRGLGPEWGIMLTPFAGRIPVPVTALARGVGKGICA